MPCIKKPILAAALLAAGALAPAISSMPAAAQETQFIAYGTTFEQLEYRGSSGSDVLAWDGDFFVGTDEWKFVWQTEGEYATEPDEFETLENQFLVTRLITDFFDLKAGIRYDAPAGEDRAYGVLGLQGLAPQFIEVDTDLFVSEKGDVSARLDLDYEILITNRIVLTPTAEIDFAFSDDEDIGVGSGLVSTEFGLRLSYDLIDRAIAPYFGVHYERVYFETADFARDEGEDVDDIFGVMGVKIRL